MGRGPEQIAASGQSGAGPGTGQAGSGMAGVGSTAGMNAVVAERRGDVLVLSLVHPPVNAISAAMRSGLAVALEQALGDHGIRAVVIRGEGKGFSAGADITEFGKLGETLGLGTLCLRIENSTKPVVAALHGTVLGGGLEIAMACHHRVAHSGAWLGLPEVNLGLLPGAGGTQRLPRLIGAADALKLMMTGVPVAADRALALGLVDQVVAGDVTEAAVGFAAAAKVRRTSAAMSHLADSRAYQQAVAAARGQVRGQRLPAAARIVDCVEAAALLPFEQALGYERTGFEDLVDSPESSGLRHAFFAERRASLPPPELARQTMQKRQVIGIWGAQGAGELVVQALSVGWKVVLVDANREAMIATLERISNLQSEEIESGNLTEVARDADWARLQSSLGAEPLYGLDLVLVMPDAGPVPPTVAPAAVLLVGSLPPGRADGVALTPAAKRGDLCELAMGRDSSAVQGALALGVARGLGWRVVFTGAGGTIERRLRQALASAVGYAAQRGVAKDAVTAALAAFGMGASGNLTLPAMPKGGEALVRICLEAMANQGALLLEQGVARRPGDIDAVALFSGLVPRWEGGPMYWADRRGALVLRSDLRARSQSPSDAFAPALLLDQLIAEGRNFAAMNKR